VLPAAVVFFAAILSLAACALGKSPGAPAPAEPAAPAPAGAATGEPSVVEKLPAEIQEHVPSWARREFLGVAVWQAIAAVAFLAVGYLVKKVSDVLTRRARARFEANAEQRFEMVLAASAGRPLGYLILLAGVAGALWVLPLPEQPTDVKFLAFAVVKILLVADVLWFLFRAIDAGVAALARLSERGQSRFGDQLVPMLRKLLKAVIAIVCVLWVVQLLGYSVTSLLAGLGIGGLAVALALQDTLANFFGSVFIFADRPFKVGDQVKIGDVEGVVEEIGFRSTRIRTWPTSLVSIPNRTVAGAAVENLSRMKRRRVMQTLGLPYKTGPDELERAVAAVRETVAGDSGVDPEDVVVRFSDFGATGLQVLVIYYTRAVAYGEHLAAKERVNLAVMRRLRELGLSIGPPT
jgi:MscS family membrane protein